jgi:hypothetical protein
MKVKVLSSTIIVSLIICGEKILIFYNKSEEGKNIERGEWENFEAGEQFSTWVPVIVLIILFCNLKTLVLDAVWPQKITPYEIIEWKYE